MASSREAFVDHFPMISFKAENVFELNRACEPLRYWCTRQGHCSFRNVNSSRFEGLRSSHVHPVQDPSSLLSPHLNLSEAERRSARTFLGRLKELSGSFGCNYQLKADVLPQLFMRLIILPDRDRLHQPQPKSYIAVSYRWKPTPDGIDPCSEASSSISKGRRLIKRGIFMNHRRSNSSLEAAGSSSIFGTTLALPCSRTLFEGLLQERNSADEGIWIDRYCIDQENEMEKQIAIPAMDIIYKAARKVVILIEDIVISNEEENMLQYFIKKYEASPAIAEYLDMVLDFTAENHEAMNYMASEEFRRNRSPEYQPLKEAMRFQNQELKWLDQIARSRPFQSFLSKLYRASWFDRAWCAHELRMSGRHIFLFACQNKNTLLRFDGAFLLRFFNILSERKLNQDIGGVEGSLRSKARAKAVDYLYRLFKSEHMSSLKTVLSHRFGHDEGNNTENVQTSTTPCLMQLYKETIFLGAGGDPTILNPIERARNGVRDKLSIILNTAGLNVFYTGDNLDEDDCLRNVVMCSLASLDGTILCTTGPPLRCPGGNSWIQNIAYDDWSRNDTFSAWDGEAISIGTDQGLEYVSLPLTFPGDFTCWLSLNGDSIVPEGNFADGNLIRSPTAPGMSAVEALEATMLALEAFKDDINDIIRSRERNHATGLLEALEPQSLLVLIAKTLTCYLRFQVGHTGSVVRLPFIPADQIVFDTHDVKQGFNRILTWIFESVSSGNPKRITEQLRGDMRYIASYITYIVEEALPPASHKSMFSMTWEPFVLHEWRREEAKILLFLPMPPEEVGKVHIAVPTGLVQREFAHLPRVWILVKKSDRDNSSWQLLAKTKMLWDANVFCASLSERTPRSRQRVYGFQDMTSA